MTTPDRWQGRAALIVAHCAGMIDLVALPVWVGTLVAKYQLDPQQAGGLVTLFLAAVVLSSISLSALFARVPPRLGALAGFVVAAAAFGSIPSTASYLSMAVLHAVAGLGVGTALSLAHGSMGRSASPHRLFAMAGLALGSFGVVFLGGSLKLVEAFGGAALFFAFAVTMSTAAVVTLLAFPSANTAQHGGERPERQRFSLSVWCVIVGVSLMAFVQAMTFSFVQRMGIDRGFETSVVTGVLIAVGLFNLLPPIAAAMLERRWAAKHVVVVGPLVQACLALVLTQTTGFVAYAAGAILFTAVIIFTHTFAFGLLSRLDPSGRAVAATPAMLMIGSATGPFVGGTLLKLQGYESIGIAALCVAVVAAICFAQTVRKPAPAAA